MSKAMTYVNAALGSTGFAVLSAKVAYRLMPDNWCDAIDANHDLASKTLPAKLNSVQGCTAYLVRFAEFESGLIKVLSRSADQLAQRIEWVTGYRVRQLVLASELIGTLDPADVAPRNVSPASGDLHPDAVTAEPRKVCGECEWASTGSSCTNSGESGIERPAMNTPRLCKAFRPKFESLDSRTARQLWPELWTLTAATK
jgi:hypothetical protein